MNERTLIISGGYVMLSVLSKSIPGTYCKDPYPCFWIKQNMLFLKKKLRQRGMKVYTCKIFIPLGSSRENA